MKRGQAALEFLMTYGWAFLVVLILIGALAYFGVLSPKNFMGDKCLAPGGGFTCKAYKLTNQGAVDHLLIDVDLNNMKGQDLVMMASGAGTYAVSLDGVSCSAITTTTDKPTQDATWSAESIGNYQISATCANLAKGKKSIVKIDIPYKMDATTTITQTVVLEITAKVQ